MSIVVNKGAVTRETGCTNQNDRDPGYAPTLSELVEVEFRLESGPSSR